MSLDDDDLKSMLQAVRKFAESELAPHAQERDENKHFPVDVMRRAGELGSAASASLRSTTASGFPARSR